jgi:PAS domain S-box-containing protein
MNATHDQNRPESSLDASNSAELHRILFEEAADGMFMTDPQGRCIAMNPRITALLGYSREEILGMVVTDLIPPEDVAVEPIRMDSLRQGKTIVTERRLRCKGGGLVLAEITTRMLPAGNMLGIVRDIAERKRAEEAVRREVSFSDNIINALPGVFYMYNDKSSLVRWNQKLEKETGYAGSELLGKDVLDFFTETHKPDIIAGVQAAFAQGEAFAEAPLLTKDGRLIPYFWTGRIVTLDDNQYMIGLGLDITGFKQSEAEKAALHEQLIQARKMESVGRLAGGVAHDFNNMLAAIMGHAELARRRAGLPESIQGDLKVIEDAAQRSADLVRQLLAFASKQTAAPVLMNLNDGVTGILKMLRRLIGENIDLALNPGADLWAVKMDPSQVDQVLVNLCVNARDAIAGVGRITIETGNRVFGKAGESPNPGGPHGEYVMLAVSDDGSGMSPEVMEHLFEPFYTTKEMGKGTGLGLATVYGIVKQNGGFVDVASEPGKGSILKVFLPRFSEMVAHALTVKSEAMPRGHGETVMLVEDEMMILNVSTQMLETLGYTVLTAATPMAALEAIGNHNGQIALLITDVIMPEMNGRELVSLIRKRKPGLKCMFISGYTADIIDCRGMLDEGVQFLQKPFSMKDLAVRVRQALDL